MTHEKDISVSWQRLQQEAAALAAQEKSLAPLLTRVILSATSLPHAVALLIAEKFTCADAERGTWLSILGDFPPEEETVARDLQVILKNDPAAVDLVMPFLFFKGFLGLQAHRLSHALWLADRTHLAAFIQNAVSVQCGMDIHPAARIGNGIMMDHATGIVIGATAVVEDDVLFWHGVTLGGRGSADIDRHPKIRKGALLGAQALIIGNIEIGENARIGAGSTVMRDVAAGETVVGPQAASITKTGKPSS